MILLGLHYLKGYQAVRQNWSEGTNYTVDAAGFVFILIKTRHTNFIFLIPQPCLLGIISPPQHHSLSVCLLLPLCLPKIGQLISSSNSAGRFSNVDFLLKWTFHQNIRQLGIQFNCFPSFFLLLKYLKEFQQGLSQ